MEKLTCRNCGVVNEVADEALTSFRWCGFDWLSEDSINDTAGPGSNWWLARNAYVGDNGKLHLKITKELDGRWYCAEAETTTKVVGGTFIWKTTGSLTTLDPYIVFGLFVYPKLGDNKDYDGLHEIDAVEWARWRNPSNPPCNYTVYSSKNRNTSKSKTFNPAMVNPLKQATHKLIWKPGVSVEYVTWDGWDTTKPPACSYKITWNQVSKVAQPIFMNLWMQSRPVWGTNHPDNNRPVEIIVDSFSYSPRTAIHETVQLLQERIEFLEAAVVRLDEKTAAHERS